MPLGPERLDHRVCHRLATALALGAVPVGVATHAPRVALLFDKRRRRVKGVTALCAEEVACVPLGAARDNHLALDGRLARFAARGEELVEVERAEEALRRVDAVFGLQACHVVGRGMRVEEGEVDAGLARTDALTAFGVFGIGLWVEGDTFELLTTLIARETLWVEAQSCGRDGAASDRECTLGTESAVADDLGRCPVGARAGAAAERLLCVLCGVRQGTRTGGVGAVSVRRGVVDGDGGNVGHGRRFVETPSCRLRRATDRDTRDFTD